MKILKVIHGYPPLYNAGSEVYSQLLCHGLSKKNEVCVFTREENSFAVDFRLRVSSDTLNPSIKLNIINIPSDKFRYCYQIPQVDQIFYNLLLEFRPDIVHIGHLSHLSTSLILEIVKQKIPIVYTLHDYWLMCPRGQFIQRNPAPHDELWALCNEQVDQKCAQRCYAGYFSGAVSEKETDVAYWADWVNRRMRHMREISQYVDRFIAPSHYLYDRFTNEFNLEKDQVTYLDYGFSCHRLKNRCRIPDKIFTFGYIGTHIPAKGIQHLIQAFGLLDGECKLIIWGRPRPQNTNGLYAIVSELNQAKQDNIEWRSEYRNEQIVQEVFNHVDCIVVPSIWVENSPLVIHEALQVRVPVITADAGGMAEYIQHEQNGLLFEHRNPYSLAEQMQRLVNEPDFSKKLGARGYLQSKDGNIPPLDRHTEDIEFIYRQLLH
ncbi:glycosyltransferase [Mycoavidus sp. B2-EB]|uniref:glycosyltransferase n=1 Tax=Mycoavidus sp. B2-EB TaxID=2651972 RepID=UPI0018E0887C|nr:glycosyltransferase [Mycoavidus sp. B2-EB]BBO59250.1 glycosyl transferase [Mycoavidus sp. B2-EB]